MSNRVVRKILWYFSWLICLPAVGWGISQGNLPLAGVALPLFLVCLYYSLRKLVCPSCGYVMRTISSPIRHCMMCGTALPESARPATDSEPAS